MIANLRISYIDDVSKASPKCLDYADTIIDEVETYFLEKLTNEA